MSGEHEHCPFCGDDMCDGRCYDALVDRLANAGIDLVAKDRRIAELEAIVAKLPHTADGVPVVPGSMVWHPDYLWRSWEVDYDNDYGEYTVAINPDRKGNEWEEDFVTECYSNHAAAEKASQS